MARKILVVDDEKPIVDLISFNLKKEGHDIIEANDGEQAYNMALSEKPDLILMDYEMPNMSGPEVFQALAANPETADIPIVFLTGVNDASKIQGGI